MVLLDEPFRGLDDLGLQALIQLAAERARRGATVLIVAPLIDAVLPVADATYRIEAGTVEETTSRGRNGAPVEHP